MNNSLKTKRLEIRLSPQQYDELLGISVERKISMGSVCRYALTQYIARQKGGGGGTKRNNF